MLTSKAWYFSLLPLPFKQCDEYDDYSTIQSDLLLLLAYIISFTFVLFWFLYISPWICLCPALSYPFHIRPKQKVDRFQTLDAFLWGSWVSYTCWIIFASISYCQGITVVRCLMDAFSSIESWEKSHFYILELMWDHVRSCDSCDSCDSCEIM